MLAHRHHLPSHSELILSGAKGLCLLESWPMLPTGTTFHPQSKLILSAASPGDAKSKDLAFALGRAWLGNGGSTGLQAGEKTRPKLGL